MRLSLYLLAVLVTGSCALNCSSSAYKDAFVSYNISNSKGMRAQFIPFGGTLTHLYFPDKKGVPRDIILGWDDPTQYCSNPVHPYFGALIGRYANRIANGTFELNGKTYKTPLNDKGHDTLHGGTVGFDQLVWAVHQPSRSSLELTLVSEDGDMGFPGNLVVRVTYTITEQNEWVIDYAAVSDADTIINLSDHTYWNLNAFLDGQETVLNQVLMIDAPQYVQVDSFLIPTGNLGQVAKEFWLDFTKPKLIGKDIANGTVTPTGGYDNAWVLREHGPQDPPGPQDPAVTLYSDVTGIKLELTTTQPSIQFYSGNFLDGTIPKKMDQSYNKTNQFYQKYSCVVLETQYYPDSIHHPQWPTTILKAKEPYVQQAKYKLSIGM